MRIISGQYEVLQGGSLLTFDDGPVEFRFQDQEKEMIFRMVFLKDDKEGINATKFTLASQFEMEMRFITFADTLGGVYVVNPIPLGSVNGRRLYLRYRVEKHLDQVRTISYTWYLGEEVTNG